MKRLNGLALLALAAVLAIAAAGGDADRLALPTHLAEYRTWPRLLKEPRPVSEELWVLCRPPTPIEHDEARQKDGPHAEHLVMVYATRDVARGLSTKVESFAPGAIIAKEKVSRSGRALPEGLAFMIKHESPKFKATGGWEFQYYPASGDRRKTHEHCATCHQNSQSRDYVLGAYPLQ